jgi:hypothetical protein
MMTRTTPKVFICYAHQDNEGGSNGERWLDRLKGQLEPLQLMEQAEIWSDQRIELGDDWHERIQETLQEVSVAVLLVSPSFLGSRYIRNSELPVLLMNAKSRGVTILPIILRAGLWRETTFKYPDPKNGPEELSLSTFQMPTSKPLNALSQDKQDEALYQVARRIHDIVNKKEEPSQPANNSPSTMSTRDLIEKLTGLVPSEFDKLILIIDAPLGDISHRNAPQSDRVNDLIRWASSPTGGDALLKIQQELDKLINRNS